MKEKETNTAVGDYGTWNQLVKGYAQKEAELYWVYFSKEKFGTWFMISNYPNPPAVRSKETYLWETRLSPLLETFLIYSAA